MLSPSSLRQAALCSALLVAQIVTAQLNLGGGVRLSGNANIQYQFYDTSQINGGGVFPRQQKHLPQFTANLNINYKNKIKIPLQLYLAPVVQVPFGVNTPAEGAKSLNILQYLGHPVNRIYAQPSFGNFKFHLGHFVQHYSPLSTGDIKVLGVGVEYGTSVHSIKAQRGVIQPRVANVGFNFGNGTYRRSLSALSYQRVINDGLRSALHLTWVNDQKSSLDSIPMVNRPEQTAVLSWQSSYQLNAKTRLNFELANSSWAPNSLAADTLREFAVGSIFMPNTTVFSGLAFALGANSQIGPIPFSGDLSYKSRNFRTLAYPFMQSDMLDIELRPRYVAPNKSWQAAGTLAFKSSNVSNTQASRLSIPIVKLSGNYKFSPQLFTNVVYAFNAVSGEVFTTGQKLRSSNHVLRLLPSYQFNRFGMKHTASLIIGMNRYRNTSEYLTQATAVGTNNLGLSLRSTYGLHSGGLSLNIFNTRNNGQRILRYSTATISGRTQLLDKKLTPYARLTLTLARNATMAIGHKRVTQFGALYRLNQKMSASLGGSVHFARQGTGRDAPGYRELLLRTGLSFRL